MADFEKALQRTLTFEGGYSNNPNDKGGETFHGISRKDWPQWDGWVIIDSFPNKKALPPTQFFLGENEYNKDELSRLVSGFYRLNFWTPLRADEIESQEIANYLFDFAVNSGIGDAVKGLQWSLNKFFRPDNDPFNLKVDGIWGEKTSNEFEYFQTLNEPFELLAHLRTYRLHHILKNISNGNIHQSFAKGLAERALA